MPFFKNFPRPLILKKKIGIWYELIEPMPQQKKPYHLRHMICHFYDYIYT